MVVKYLVVNHMIYDQFLFAIRKTREPIYRIITQILIEVKGFYVLIKYNMWYNKRQYG